MVCSVFHFLTLWVQSNNLYCINKVPAMLFPFALHVHRNYYQEVLIRYFLSASLSGWCTVHLIVDLTKATDVSNFLFLLPDFEKIIFYQNCQEIHVHLHSMYLICIIHRYSSSILSIISWSNFFSEWMSPCFPLHYNSIIFHNFSILYPINTVEFFLGYINSIVVRQLQIKIYSRTIVIQSESILFPLKFK